ncbi:unnamed protein product [Meloidogyne enterolobii]|uniref:Uncharacterized protein n=1 Tax=Meloidogyne enterolobii TaxID=390850 RepID=A0ACB0Y5N6_MELEN
MRGLPGKIGERGNAGLPGIPGQAGLRGTPGNVSCFYTLIKKGVTE